MGFWLRFMLTRRFVFLLLATLKALFVLEFAPQRFFLCLVAYSHRDLSIVAGALLLPGNKPNTEPPSAKPKALHRVPRFGVFQAVVQGVRRRGFWCLGF